MMRTFDSPSTDAADTLLIERARAGGLDAFNALARRYSRVIYGIGWSITGRAEDADDVVQDTFLAAHAGLHDLKDASKFPGWITRIARNAAYDVLSRRKRHRIDESWLREQDMIYVADDHQIEHRRLDQLWFSLATLTPDDRSTVVLHYLVGLDQQQVATSLGVPLGTIKSRLNRARRILKGKIADMANTNFDELGPESDFGRTGLGGMEGDINWEPLLRGTDLDGWRELDTPLANSTPEEHGRAWSRDGESLVGRVSGEKTSRIVKGDTGWHDYEVSVLGTLVEGSNLQIHFRVSDDGEEFYLLDFLYGWQVVAISKMGRGAGEVVKLSVVNFPFEIGREYNIVVAVRGQSLTSYIDGKLVNQVTDDSYRSGGIGLNLWWHTTSNYRDPRIRHYH